MKSVEQQHKSGRFVRWLNEGMSTRHWRQRTFHRPKSCLPCRSTLDAASQESKLRLASAFHANSKDGVTFARNPFHGSYQRPVSYLRFGLLISHPHRRRIYDELIEHRTKWRSTNESSVMHGISQTRLQRWCRTSHINLTRVLNQWQYSGT